MVCCSLWCDEVTYLDRTQSPGHGAALTFIFFMKNRMDAAHEWRDPVRTIAGGERRPSNHRDTCSLLTRIPCQLRTTGLFTADPVPLQLSARKQLVGHAPHRLQRWPLKQVKNNVIGLSVCSI